MIAGIALLWWAPSILLAGAVWQGRRLRFGAVMGLGRLLVLAGCPGAASKLYGAENARAERRMQTIKSRRGW